MGMLVTLLQQHKILSKQMVVWQSDIEWNEAPDVTGGSIDLNEIGG